MSLWAKSKMHPQLHPSEEPCKAWPPPTATRSRPRAIKGQEPGLVDVLLQPTEQTRSHRKAEVVNELLWVAGPKERSPVYTPEHAYSYVVVYLAQ